MTYSRTLTAELLATINEVHEALYYGGSRPTPLKAAIALNCLADQLRAADERVTELEAVLLDIKSWLDEHQYDLCNCGEPDCRGTRFLKALAPQREEVK